MRHEDYPCCGCGPEGCIDFNTTTECRDCGKSYHPDDNTQSYCYACQAREEDDLMEDRLHDEEDDYSWEIHDEEERDRYESNYLYQDQMDY